jgi:hypothetical protein
LIGRLLKAFAAAATCSLPLAAAPPDAEISFVGQFGERGNQGPAGAFYYPHDIEVDSSGNLIIVEWGNARIQRCSPQGECEIIVENLTQQPAGLAIDDQDRMLLTSWPDAHNITICQPDGECSVLFGDFGAAPGEFNDPSGIEIDSRGRIVIADRQNDRMQFCDYQGDCIAFGSFNSGPDAVPGEFWEPAGTLADGTGRLFIGETGDEVISVCDEDGKCVARMGVAGTGVGEFKTPSSLALTSRGDLVVVEVSNHRIQLCDLSDYDLAGDCIAFGEQGIGEGQFRAPHGVYVDADDRVLISDQDNHRIQILQISYRNGQSDFRINAGLNDAWFDSATPGQGFFITVFEDIQTMFLTWFTFDAERPPTNVEAIVGEPGHRWLTAQGTYQSNVATLDISLTRGGVFDKAMPQPDSEAQGTIRVEFQNCNAAMLSFDMPSAGLAGEMPLERLALDNVRRCEIMTGQ